MHPGGIRLGVSEVTRLGMKEQEMIDIAEFMKRAVLDNDILDAVGGFGVEEINGGVGRRKMAVHAICHKPLGVIYMG